MGGVAAMPGALPKPKPALVGKQTTEAAFRQAARLAMVGARPLSENGFKVDLGMHSVVRALTIATSQASAG